MQRVAYEVQHSINILYVHSGDNAEFKGRNKNVRRSKKRFRGSRGKEKIPLAMSAKDQTEHDPEKK